MNREKGRDLSREEFLDRLFEALSEDESIDTIQRALVENGVDVERVVAEGSEAISDFLRRQKLVRGRERFEAIKKAVEGLRMHATESTHEVREAIARAIAGENSGRGYQVAHRKLASVAKEDLESLEDDAAIIEFIARLDEGGEDRE